MRGLTPIDARFVSPFLWALAVAIALLARRWLEPPADVPGAWLLYVAGALLLVPMAWEWSRGWRAPPLSVPTRLAVRGRRRLVSAAPFALGLGLAWLSYRLAGGSAGHRSVELVWVAGLAAIVVAAVVADGLGPYRPSLRVWFSSKVNARVVAEVVLVAGILLSALALRLPDLSGTPATVHNDEAAVGLEARQFLSGENAEIFTVGFGAIPRMSYAIPAFVMRVFGDDLFGFRTTSVLLGTASILLAYLLARRLFGTRFALIASVLMAVAQWHIHFSRSGISYMQAVPVTLLVLLFVVRGSDLGRWLDWVLAGFGMALCIEVYYAARIAPALAVLYVVHRAIRERGFLAARWRGLVVCGLAAAAFFAPMAAFYSDHPSAFNERGRAVSILNPDVRAHEEQVYGVDTLAGVVVEQTKRTLASLNGAATNELQYGGKLTDSLTGALVVLGGLLFIALGLRDPRFSVLAVWLWGTLLSGVLYVDAPFSPHVIGATPAFVFAAALVFELGWWSAERAFGRVGGVAMATVACAGLATIGYLNYRDYFARYVDSHPADPPTVLARYATRVDGQYRIYVLPGGSTPLEHETIRFLAPALDGRELPTSESVSAALRGIPMDRGAAFVVPLGAATSYQLAKISAAYPAAREQGLPATIGRFFKVVLVDRKALERPSA